MRNRFLTRLLTLVIGLGAGGPAWGEGWERVGLPGGDVQVLSVAASNPSQIYAVVGGRFYRSSDGGTSWTEGIMPSRYYTTQVVVMAVHPASPATVYVGSHLESGTGEICRSVDMGSSWSGCTTIGYLYGIVIAPSNPTTMYAATGNGFSRSADGGVTWSTPVWSGPNPGFREVSSVVADAADSNIVYAGVDGAVYKSTNGGGNWLAASTGLPNLQNVRLVPAPADPDTLYAFGNGQVYRTTDGGTAWGLVPLLTQGVLYLAVDPSNSLTLYAYGWDYGANDWGMRRSTDGGATWAMATRPPVLPEFVLANDLADISVGGDGTLWVESTDGVFRSSDGASTWTAASDGIAGGAAVTSVALDATGPEVVYAGKSGDGVWKSTDGGVTWAPTALGRMDDSGVRVLVADPIVPGIVYSAGNGLHGTVDGGDTWADIAAGLPNVAVVAIAVDSDGTVYVGMGSPGGVYRSNDRGATWAPAMNGFLAPDVTGLVAEPSAPGTLYAGTSGFGVYRTTDGGNSWVPVNRGLTISTAVQALAVDASFPGTVYASATEGFFKTVDGGERWTLLFPRSNSSVSDIAVDPEQGGVVYFFAVLDGLTRSLDGGSSWDWVETGVPDDFLVVIGPGGVIYGYGGDQWLAVSGFYRHYECGDGVRNPDEQCDDGDDASCPGACRVDCTCPLPPVCGNAVVEPGEDCDGGYDWDYDCCSSSCRFESAGWPCVGADPPYWCHRCGAAGQCAPLPPRTDCGPSESGRGLLYVSDPTEPGGYDGSTKWKWIGIAPVTLTDLGDPTGSDDYEICGYDGGSNPVLGARLLAGASCLQGPCWSVRGTSGFKWRDPLASVSWIKTFKVKAGEAGQSKMTFKGKGFLAPPLPLTTPVRVQVSRENGPCWEGIFSSPTSNTPSTFSAYSD